MEVISALLLFASCTTGEYALVRLPVDLAEPSIPVIVKTLNDLGPHPFWGEVVNAPPNRSTWEACYP